MSALNVAQCPVALRPTLVQHFSNTPRGPCLLYWCCVTVRARISLSYSDVVSPVSDDYRMVSWNFTKIAIIKK